MNANAFDVTGRTAVVTGANTGIGQGIAVALAQAGADVVLVARRDPSETRRLVENAGRRAHVVMADLSSIEPCERIVAETVETFGQLDILVNNAGIIRRNDALDFLEHFLSTLPDVALGGLDLTAARNGEVRRIYELAYAWLNLIETIEGAFYGETESSLTVGDLALLSGLDTRTIRNRCGPDKLIRTSAARTSQDRNSASPAFVHLHALDAVDWLRSRKDFHVSAVDPGWITQRLANANPANSTRGLLMASIVNLGPLASLAPAFDFTVEDARRWFDEGELLPASISEALIQKIQEFEGTL